MQPVGVLLVLGLGLSVAACSGTSGMMGADPVPPATSAEAIAQSTLAQARDASGKLTVDAEFCPRADVRDGTNIYRVGPDNPLTIRYQGTITDTARECTLEGNSMRVRVGIEGRVISGPNGGPGTVNLPIRVSLLTGLNGKVVTSKFRNVPVQIGASGPGATFSTVESDIVFALPGPEAVKDYIIFVGFDSHGRNADATPRRKKRR